MGGGITRYYDQLGPEYRHNMGWDWDAGMREEGATLSRFLEQRIRRPGPYAVLDCSCGIGTQAIGLALQGHRVHATDLSPESLECARKEAGAAGVEMSFEVADFRKLGQSIKERFEVVLSCDNSIAHCLNDQQLAAALSSMKARLKAGGLLLISLRDYAPLVADKPRFNNQHVQERPDGRRVAFQLWDWAIAGDRYRNHQFLIKETNGSYAVKHFETELRALSRDEMLAAVQGAGYEDACWHLPEESGYYQPIVTAANPE